MSRISTRRSDPSSLTGETVALLGCICVFRGQWCALGVVRLAYELDGTHA